MTLKNSITLWRQNRQRGDDSDEESGDDRPRLPQFAPPASYAPVLGDPDEKRPPTLGDIPAAKAHVSPPGPPPKRPDVVERLATRSTELPPPGPPPVKPVPARRSPSVSGERLAPQFVRSHGAELTSSFIQRSERSPSPCAISDHPFDAATFAERLMARYGYKEGEGLVCVS